MNAKDKSATAAVRGRPDDTAEYGSNDVRLSGREWIAAALIVLPVLVGLPIVWGWAEPFDPDADYRIGYRLSEDYWLFDRYCRRACAEDKTLLIGDSVVWGHYVTEENTLSHHLNEAAGRQRFANLGVDGTHPAALAGLIEHYGTAISGKWVVLHCNLLWMSSKRHDLQTEKEFRFNHPALVPQFHPRIPCYKEPIADRLSIVVRRGVDLFAWAEHLRIAYFERADIPTWTIDHPYSRPLGPILRKRPYAREGIPPDATPRPWTEKGIQPFGPDWVALETSLQWASFKRLVAILTDRDNRLFVLVGPFNEHMLTEESLAVYRQRIGAVESWLRRSGIAYHIPPPLPSELYADASHPLGDGYKALARRLYVQEAFARFDGRRRAGSQPNGSQK